MAVDGGGGDARQRGVCVRGSDWGLGKGMGMAGIAVLDR